MIEERLERIEAVLEELVNKKAENKPCEDEYLTTDEVAAFIKKSVAHVHYLKANGVIKRHPLGFLKSEILAVR